MITGLAIAGTPVDPWQVLIHEVTVIHGRATVTDGPTASSATITVLVPASAGWPSWTAGDPMTVTADTGPLFTGTIAERRLLEHVTMADLGQCARIELLAAGTLATLGGRPVGDIPWVQETEPVRAERILTAASVPHQVQTPTGPPYTVLPRDVDAQPALNLLQELSAATGAAVVDLPDGTVLYQPLQCRSQPVFALRWQDVDPATTWAAFDPATTWADLGYRSPASETPLPLPPVAVEYEPEWAFTAGSIINQVGIGYGTAEPQDTVTLSDQASIDRFGVRHVYEGGQLATSADASARASKIINTQAREGVALRSVTVHADFLDTATGAAVAALRCGDWVQVDNLPQPAPAVSWAGIVEGWTYQEWADASGAQHETWTLNLSDPTLSLAVPTWADFTPTFTWAGFNPLVTWADLVTLESIGAA